MREEGMSDWAHRADEAVLVACAGFERRGGWFVAVFGEYSAV